MRYLAAFVLLLLPLSVNAERLEVLPAHVANALFPFVTIKLVDAPQGAQLLFCTSKTRAPGLWEQCYLMDMEHDETFSCHWSADMGNAMDCDRGV